jgi:DNA-directed RNA polymerase
VKLVKDMDSGKLAFLALQQIITGISNDTPLSRRALSIGRAVENEINLSAFQEKEQNRCFAKLCG